MCPLSKPRIDLTGNWTACTHICQITNLPNYQFLLFSHSYRKATIRIDRHPQGSRDFRGMLQGVLKVLQQIPIDLPAGSALWQEKGRILHKWRWPLQKALTARADSNSAPRLAGPSFLCLASLRVVLNLAAGRSGIVQCAQCPGGVLARLCLRRIL